MHDSRAVVAVAMAVVGGGGGGGAGGGGGVGRGSRAEVSISILVAMVMRCLVLCCWFACDLFVYIHNIQTHRCSPPPPLTNQEHIQLHQNQRF